VLKEFSVSPKVKTIYFTINYEKGVAFSRFNAYQKPDGTWVVLSFVFNTEASQVFPASLLSD
jgi:lipoprotein signal peptidase